MTSHTLADIGRSIHAAHILVVSTLPGGALRTVQSSNPSASMNRLYTASGQFVDAPTWEALLSDRPIRSSDYLTAHPEAKQDFHGKWLGRLGYAHAISAPLQSPVVTGFPGALVALGSMGQPPFTEQDLQTLAASARAFDADAVVRSDARFAPKRSPGNRLFIVMQNGDFKGHQPHESLDPTLADNLTAFARRRVMSEAATTAGDRVQLLDAAGEAHAFTLSTHESYPALGTGRVLILAAVPHFTEWLALRPEDFAADQEIGRLLPAFKYMFEHYQEGITLPNIASHVHLSPFHFHRRFTELLGITPKHFLFDCQIARAQELLLEATHELEEIAKLCGFAHQSHFTSRFKQATGLTPTRWRKSRIATMRDATPIERARAV